MNDQESIIEDLLVHWEILRSEGTEISVAQLCVDVPTLMPIVADRVATLKSLSWVGEPEALVTGSDDMLDYAEETELPDSDMTVAEFVSTLSDSGVLNLEEQRRLVEQAFTPDARATAVAQQLVDQGLITHYQARVILQRGDSPLLLDRYVILDTIGAGGMGLVFKALHQSLERIVAIKVLPKFAVDSPEQIERFQRELRAVAKISHPNVVQAFDAHESNGVYFFAMEFVPGSDLYTLVLDDGPIDAKPAMEIIRQAAEGLGAAHDLGVVHRDVKPGNILLSDSGQAKVLDLGLAQSGDFSSNATDQPLTQAGLAMGTVPYMSPEQAFDAHSADERSDIYSLGCTLYYLLHGKPMFECANSVQSIIAHRETPAPRLGEMREDVSAGLEKLFQSMVAKNPADRPQSMQAVAQQLTEIDGQPSSSKPSIAPIIQAQPKSKAQSKPVKKTKTKNRATASAGGNRQSRWGLWAVAAALIAAVVGFIAYAMGDNQSSQPKWNQQQVDQFARQSLIDDSMLLTLKSPEYGQFIPETVDDLTGDYKLIGVDLLTEETGRFERFASLPDLRQISILGDQYSTGQYDGLNQLTNLKVFSMQDCEIGDDVVSAISKLVNLKKLSLDYCALPRDCTALESLAQLKELSLYGSDVNNRQLNWISKLSELDYLDLSGTRAKLSIASQLTELKKLTMLNVSGVSLGGDIQALGELTALTQLLLDATEFGDEHVSVLQNMPVLATLDVGYTALTPKGIKQIAMIQTLDDLALNGLNVRTAIDDIAALPKLTVLDLTGTDITDADLDVLSRQRSLQALCLDSTDVSDRATERFLARLPSCDIITNMSEQDLGYPTP